MDRIPARRLLRRRFFFGCKIGALNFRKLISYRKGMSIMRKIRSTGISTQPLSANAGRFDVLLKQPKVVPIQGYFSFIISLGYQSSD